MTMTITLNLDEQAEAAKLWLKDQGHTVLGTPTVEAGPDGPKVTAVVQPKPKRKRPAAAE